MEKRTVLFKKTNNYIRFHSNSYGVFSGFYGRENILVKEQNGEGYIESKRKVAYDHLHTISRHMVEVPS